MMFSFDRRPVTALTLGMLLLGAAPICAQSLADAARRAQEQRDKHLQSPTFTDNDLAAVAASSNREAAFLELTMPRLQQYRDARTSMLRTLVKSPVVAGRLREAIAGAGREGADGFERAYSREPSVVEAIGAAQMTTHDYAVTEVAFMVAVGVLAGRIPASVAQAGTIGSNIEFLKRHQAELEVMWRETSALEAQLASQIGPASPKF